MLDFVYADKSIKAFFIASFEIEAERQKKERKEQERAMKRKGR